MHVGVVAFPIFDRCFFSVMCPVHNCTRSDMCLRMSLLVSFAKAAEGIDGSTLSAFSALGDLAKNSLASLCRVHICILTL